MENRYNIHTRRKKFRLHVLKIRNKCVCAYGKQKKAKYFDKIRTYGANINDEVAIVRPIHAFF